MIEELRTVRQLLRRRELLYLALGVAALLVVLLGTLAILAHLWLLVPPLLVAALVTLPLSRQAHEVSREVGEEALRLAPLLPRNEPTGA